LAAIASASKQIYHFAMPCKRQVVNLFLSNASAGKGYNENSEFRMDAITTQSAVLLFEPSIKSVKRGHVLASGRGIYSVNGIASTPVSPSSEIINHFFLNFFFLA
jgi:hypothetical protein